MEDREMLYKLVFITRDIVSNDEEMRDILERVGFSDEEIKDLLEEE